ncbi:MAG: hypothetical protein FWH34_00750, partial [Desulfovibrionaceae bacterium]|nr:hypothetical protein [Desulfovibrionaceae bacterium]
MTSSKRFCIQVCSWLSRAVKPLLFLPLFFVLGAVLLWPEEGVAATMRRQTTEPATDNEWYSPGNWNTGQPGTGDTAILADRTDTYPCPLILDGVPEHSAIGNLTVRYTDGWGITGDGRTLTIGSTATPGELRVNVGVESDNTIPIPGGTFTVSDGATLDVIGNTNIVSGTFALVNATLQSGPITVNSNAKLQLADASLIGTSLTAAGQYADNAGSAVNLSGAAEFLGAADREIYGSFTSDALRTEGALIIGNGTDGATVTTTGGDAVIGSNLWVKKNSTLQAAGDISANDVTLGYSGGGTLTGDNLTATGNFYAYGGSEARLSGDVNVTGSLTLEAGSLLTGNDLTVGGTYTDTADSIVKLSGMAAFLGGDVIIRATGDGTAANPGFTSEGIATLGNLTLAQGAVVDTGVGDRNINGGNGDLTVRANAQLLGAGDTYAQNVTLGNGSVLEGGKLDVGGTYTDTADSIVKLSGMAAFRGGDVTIRATGDGTAANPGFTSEGIATLGNLTLAQGAVVDTGVGDRNINGGNGDLTVRANAQLLGAGDTYAQNVTLGNGSVLEGGKLDVGGTYTD